MDFNYGPRGEPLHSDGRPMWRGLNGEPLTNQEANDLLRDANKRRIGHAAITTDRGRVEVSTVYLPLDHASMGPLPVHWETLTFGGPLNDEMIRYTSREAAVAGHEEAVAHALIAIDLAGAKVLSVEKAEIDQEPRRNA